MIQKLFYIFFSLFKSFLIVIYEMIEQLLKVQGVFPLNYKYFIIIIISINQN